MAKQPGMGDAFYITGVDISGDINSLSKISGGPAATQDMTDITQAAMARAGLGRDGGMDFAVFLDTAANQAHTALAPSGSADGVCSYFRGTAVGSPAVCCVAKQLNYDWAEGADKSVLGAVSVLANGSGLEWGIQHTAGKRTDTGALFAGLIDYLAISPGFGAQAYLQVFAFTGTDVTIKLVDSTDNISFNPVAGGAFATVTAAPQAQRIATASNLAINRYVKFQLTTVGGFTSVTYAVAVMVNPAQVVF